MHRYNQVIALDPVLQNEYVTSWNKERGGEDGKHAGLISATGQNPVGSKKNKSPVYVAAFNAAFDAAQARLVQEGPVSPSNLKIAAYFYIGERDGLKFAKKYADEKAELNLAHFKSALKTQLEKKISEYNLNAIVGSVDYFTRGFLDRAERFFNDKIARLNNQKRPVELVEGAEESKRKKPRVDLQLARKNETGSDELVEVVEEGSIYPRAQPKPVASEDLFPAGWQIHSVERIERQPVRQPVPQHRPVPQQPVQQQPVQQQPASKRYFLFPLQFAVNVTVSAYAPQQPVQLAPTTLQSPARNGLFYQAPAVVRPIPVRHVSVKVDAMDIECVADALAGMSNRQ